MGESTAHARLAPSQSGWTAAPIIGVFALGVALALVVTQPPGPLVVVAAAVATVALAVDRRLGPLPAAALVALALPWGRGADTLTFELAGLPIRPHDAVIVIGIVGALPSIARNRPSMSGVAILAAGLLAVGALAAMVGVLAGNDARDIVRDVRWWGLYGATLLALSGATTRPRLLRGILAGLLVFAGVVVVAALLPTFGGGLKDQELAYDRGVLRMQFANSAFLLVGSTYAIARFLDQGSARSWAMTALMGVAIVLSFTRTSILAAVFAGALVVLALLADVVRRRSSKSSALLRVAGLAACGVLAFAVGVAANTVATPQAATGLVGEGSSQPIGAPVDRLLPADPAEHIAETEAGRFTSYRAALEVLMDRPFQGAGLGALVDVDYAYSDARAHTLRQSPSVDDAYLTFGVKSGLAGIVLFAAFMVAVLVAGWHSGARSRRWFVPAWIGLGILTITQAFAVSFYGPFILALLASYPALAWRRGGRGLPQPWSRARRA